MQVATVKAMSAPAALRPAPAIGVVASSGALAAPVGVPQFGSVSNHPTTPAISAAPSIGSVALAPAEIAPPSAPLIGSVAPSISQRIAPVEDLSPVRPPYEPPTASIPNPPAIPGKWVPQYTRDKKKYVVPGLEDMRQTATFIRATSHAKTLDDTTSLTDWRLRGTVLGLARNPELLDSLDVDGAEHISELNFGNKLALSGIANKAMRRVGGDDGSDFGDKVHGYLQVVLEGVITFEQVPKEIQPYLAVLFAAMRHHGLSFVQGMVERTVFIPSTGLVGTFDFLVQGANGELLIGDLKGLALDTPLVTPDGWTTMGDVQVGDRVFGPDGLPTTVTAKSQVKRIGTYTVRFDDGSEIICDSEHIWWTDDSWDYSKSPTAKSVGQVRKTLVKYGRKNHRVPLPHALVMSEAKLPIDPYLLGAWLGDGTAATGAITKGEDLFSVLEKDGHELGSAWSSRSPECATRTVLGLKTSLREAGLLNNKHIPPEYMRSSIDQRTKLLQGLMDTDGTWNKARNRAVFNTTDPALARSVFELLLTLGQRPHIASAENRGYGKTVTGWYVEFNPVELQPFRLPRKAQQVSLAAPNVRSKRRVIVSIEEGPDVETVCIAVDNDSHVYLAGENMIPTHNTSSSIDFSWLSIAIQLAQYANAQLILSWNGSHWEAMPPVSKVHAVVASVPKDEPSPMCRIYVVDMVLGTEMMDTATRVRNIHEAALRATSNAALLQDGDELIAWAAGDPVSLPSTRAIA